MKDIMSQGQISMSRNYPEEFGAWCKRLYIVGEM
jgi:hypothetical protein